MEAEQERLEAMIDHTLKVVDAALSIPSANAKLPSYLQELEDVGEKAYMRVFKTAKREPT